MGGRGSSSSQPVQRAPKAEDPEVQKARADAARKRAMAQGYRSTIMTRNMTDQNSALKSTYGS